MDPPAFGRGKGGELWKLSDHLSFLIDIAQEALSDSPLFLLLNTYSDSLDDLTEAMISKKLARLGGSREIVGLGLTGSLDRQRLPLGKVHRWTATP
jgi:23S rRNA (cytosine1962-C5)-methyltransferase